MAFEPQEKIVYSGYLLRRYSQILLMVCVGLSCAPAYADELSPFTVYTYHDKPPYFSHYRYLRKSATQSTEVEQVDSAEGLYPAFIELLNQSQQQWSLSLKHLPRKRLQLRLDQNRLDGAVIGVNPLWFSDKKQIKYLWSEGFINDRDVIAVKGSSDIKYTTLEDLHGLRFAVPRGWYFVGISEKIDQDLIQSFETSSDIQNLKLIAQGRVDATVISLPTLLYFQSRMLSPGELKRLPKPHSQFQRQWLFPRSKQRAFVDLSAAIAEVSKSAAWQDLLQEKGLLPVCLSSLTNSCLPENHQPSAPVAHETKP